jgi:hypothetical protein
MALAEALPEVPLIGAPGVAVEVFWLMGVVGFMVFSFCVVC